MDEVVLFLASRKTKSENCETPLITGRSLYILLVLCNLSRPTGARQSEAARLIIGDTKMSKKIYLLILFPGSDYLHMFTPCTKHSLHIFTTFSHGKTSVFKGK